MHGGCFPTTLLDAQAARQAGSRYAGLGWAGCKWLSASRSHNRAAQTRTGITRLSWVLHAGVVR